MRAGEFGDPPWDDPIDEAAILRAIPVDSTIKGMFLLPLIELARKQGIDLGLTRERYLPFGDYPVREHAHALHAIAHGVFPHVSIRKGLRRLGHPVVDTLRATTVGRVVWSGASDLGAALHALSTAYTLTCSRARASIVELEPDHAIVRFDDVHWFLDSHHVGVCEGVLGACGVKGTVRIRMATPYSAEFLCTW
ncbi:MAG: DUF2378 family protein [Polyangiales bacterium]